jgi:alanyl-tRNA synthetase
LSDPDEWLTLTGDRYREHTLSGGVPLPGAVSLDMTERLYYRDAYLTSFSGKVAAVDGTRVHLDRTAFYPTSGGQLFDTGKLGDARIVDVIDDETGIIHVLEAAPAFSQGADVTGVIDWKRRFDHMQQHTGQHLLSALFEDMAGAKTASVHFGDESSTIDIDLEGLSRDKAAKIETRANAVVAENRAVTVSFEDAASAQGLRKASDRSGELRIVSIADLDRSACGGTHVRATGEIGAVLIRKLEKYKKMTRVEFLCGMRAVSRARGDYEVLSGLAASLSAGMDELPKLVASQKDSIQALESEKKKLTEGLAGFRARELAESTVADAAGIRRIMYRGTSLDELRALAHSMAALPKTVFVGTADSPPTIVYAASADSGVNAGADLKAALTANGGKGGGNSTIAQGTVPSADALAALANSLSGTA